jgi:hypothetical protein
VSEFTDSVTWQVKHMTWRFVLVKATWLLPMNWQQHTQLGSSSTRRVGRNVHTESCVWVIFFHSPALIGDLTNVKRSCHGTVHLVCRACQVTLWGKTQKFMWGNICHIHGSCGCGCCGRQTKSILSYMHEPLVEGDFKGEHDRPNNSNNMLMGCSKSVIT